MITIQDELEAARRELRMRKEVYPRRVAAGKMTERQAKHETACMAAIVLRLEKAAAGERLL
jgi:hypothetical protein